jgi:hypothetical protein
VPGMPIHERLLRAYIKHALEGQKDEWTALHIARKLDAGDWRIISTFLPDLDGQPDPETLAYRVEVQCSDGWAELCTIAWQLLCLEWADVMLEVDTTRQQHAEGTYPGGPMDPHREPV